MVYKIMPDEFIKIEVRGLEKIQAALAKFPREISKYLGQAGKEASSRAILPTEGLKKYPPAGAANAPPTPYYIRGRGTMTKSGLRATSERLGTQWTTATKGFSTEIGNRASYAKWVHGEEQASFMGPKGWRKLTDVVKEKMSDITRVYQAWVDKLIRDLGL